MHRRVRRVLKRPNKTDYGFRLLRHHYQIIEFRGDGI